MTNYEKYKYEIIKLLIDCDYDNIERFFRDKMNIPYVSYEHTDKIGKWLDSVYEQTYWSKVKEDTIISIEGIGNRYFSHYDEEDYIIYVYKDGTSSITNCSAPWSISPDDYNISFYYKKDEEEYISRC